MSAAHDPAPLEQMKMGPVKIVEVFTSRPPSDEPIAESLGNDSVPFEKIRHLCSGKPLLRALPKET